MMPFGPKPTSFDWREAIFCVIMTPCVPKRTNSLLDLRYVSYLISRHIRRNRSGSNRGGDQTWGSGRNFMVKSRRNWKRLQTNMSGGRNVSFLEHCRGWAAKTPEMLIDIRNGDSEIYSNISCQIDRKVKMHQRPEVIMRFIYVISTLFVNHLYQPSPSAIFINHLYQTPISSFARKKQRRSKVWIQAHLNTLYSLPPHTSRLWKRLLYLRYD